MTRPPLLLELGADVRGKRLDRVERWLATTRMLQSAYRRVLAGARDGVAEPHVRAYLGELLDVAAEHDARIDDLYAAFGRRPPAPGGLREVGAGLLGRAREALGQVEGVAAGAAGGGWRTLREALLANLDAIAGYAVTEQLGLALGVPAAVDLTLPIVRRKNQDQLLLQEYLLEFAANAVLLERGV